MKIKDVIEWIQIADDDLYRVEVIAEDANYAISAVERIKSIEPIQKLIDAVNKE
jgi:hypothetical protein